MANDTYLRKELADYRHDLQNMLASEAVQSGFLKESMGSISELSGQLRIFFEHCVRGYHAMDEQVDPLAILGSCCFAGAVAAHLWNVVGADIFNTNLFLLLTRDKGIKYLDDSALEFIGMPGGTPEGDRLAACIKGKWSIMALAAWSGAIRNRPAEEAMLFLQSTAQVLFVLGEAVVLAREEQV